ncbi:MAG: hypothetical protein EOM20_03515 [Spartobacteria bacterium]|nr:hypothetical protein [Spartobacteria bacterium]
MNAFFIIWRREMSSTFLSLIAYLTGMFFLFIMGYSFWMLTTLLARGEAGNTVMDKVFGSIFFWLAMLIIVPASTMRLFAEEMRSGTIETLMTAPVSDAAVVLAKYASALSFFVVMWIPTVAYAYVLRVFDPLMSVDYGPMLSGYLGTLLVGAFYLSVGLLASSLTRYQLVALIITFALMCVAFLAGFIPYLSSNPMVRNVGSYFSSAMHMLEFARGKVDTRPVVLYLTGTVFMLFATLKVVESRRWR